MRIPSVSQFSIVLLVSAVLAGCVGYGDVMFAKTLSGSTAADSGRFGAVNLSVGGKQGQFAMSDVSGKNLHKSVVVKGSPEDKGNGTSLDLWAPAAKVKGSVFGFRVNQAMKVTVSSRDFLPRVVVLEALTASPTAPVREYFLASDSEKVSDAGGTNVVVATYREPKDNVRNGDPTFGAFVGVLTADGKTGDYTVKVEFVN